jgi:hypothetical protein
VTKRGCLMVPLGVKDTVLLENFGDNWNGGVDRVRNHQDESLGAGLGDASSKIADDTSVDLTSEHISISVSTGGDGWTNLEQIVSEIVVNVSVFVIITGG